MPVHASTYPLVILRRNNSRFYISLALSCMIIFAFISECDSGGGRGGGGGKGGGGGGGMWCRSI